MTHDEFIERATKLWKGKSDYSLVEYTGAINKVTLICPVHGKFKQKAGAHLYGKDCLKCARDNSIWRKTGT